MNHPVAVCAKAQRLEQLLLRVAAGEPLGQVCADLRVQVSEAELADLQARYEAAGRRWEGLVDRRYGHPQKVSSAIREWLYEWKRQHPEATAPAVANAVQQAFNVAVSPGHINYLLRKVGLTGPPGHPYPKAEAPGEEGAPAAEEPELLEQAGLFFLEGAKQAMGVNEAVEQTLAEARADYREEHPQASFRLLHSEPETDWHKIDHLLYLPVLGLTRPRELYYYQGTGLRALYGFTYKYLPLEHFLGELTRLQVGTPLGQALGQCYQQGWYPGGEPLVLFTDWHVKPHWTKQRSHSGMVSRWGRVMPGTKQLLLNGSGGHLLGAWNYPIDAHFSRVLVDLEERLATQWGRPVAYTVIDAEGGGLPLGERYAAAGRNYLSILLGAGPHGLADFTVLGEWQAVDGDPEHEAVEACWKEAPRAEADPRRLVLMRRVQETEPTRIYAGRLPAELRAEAVPALHRQRWANQERVIRQMVNGANLNVNYGYTTQAVAHRTQQRQWAEAQEKVAGCERRLTECQEALTQREQQQQQLQETYQQARKEQQQEIKQEQREEQQRQQAGRGTQRCRQRQQRGRRLLAELKARFQRARQRLAQEIARRQARQTELQQELEARQAARDAIDTASLCQERDLEKDQIMVDLQVLLTSWHDWVREHFLAPEWQRLELDTALAMIYRKAGRVQWGGEEITVVLEAYRYPEQQRAMGESFRRFNAAQLRWRDGRRLRIHVAGEPQFQLCDCQGTGQT